GMRTGVAVGVKLGRWGRREVLALRPSGRRLFGVRKRVSVGVKLGYQIRREFPPHPFGVRRPVSRGGKLGPQSVAELGQPGACDTLNSDRRPPATPAAEEAYATGLAARPTRADRSAPPAG